MMNYQVSAMKHRHEGNEFNNTHHLEPLDHISDPVEKLRFLCLTQSVDGILTLGRILRKLDDGGNRYLGEREFVKALIDSGIPIYVEDARKVFHYFNTDGGKNISIDAVMEHIRPPMSDSRKKMIGECFEKIDVHGNGHVTLADLKKVYSVKFHRQYITGEEEEETLLRRFLKHFENAESDDVIITQEDFLNYYGGISASGDTDVFFDLMMRRAFKL